MKMRFGVGMGRSESVNDIGEHARLAQNSGFEHVTLVDEPFLAREIVEKKWMLEEIGKRIIPRFQS